jgi:hypothetical protein
VKYITVDAIKVGPQDGLPETVQTPEGRYCVLGVVVAQTTCKVPLMVAESSGRRLCVLLGERVPDPPTPDNPAGPTIEQRGRGL